MNQKIQKLLQALTIRLEGKKRIQDKTNYVFLRKDNYRFFLNTKDIDALVNIIDDSSEGLITRMTKANDLLRKKAQWNQVALAEKFS
ncbi:hypothetical protein [Methylobacter sp.]|uniref:hypothetical protein n=1 Tax=Methylobacter sp. TaxID=2051955 RepID=UPI001222A3AF|nr:hypothetical protein [Methylobacter sp.]TAK59546.1 MAG: hypothetical protein EPO18_20505 [Methylobacter sp.]